MNNENFDQKPCKSTRVHKSVGELSNTTEYLRLRGNGKKLDYFLGKPKNLCGSNIMACKVRKFAS